MHRILHYKLFLAISLIILLLGIGYIVYSMVIPAKTTGVGWTIVSKDANGNVIHVEAITPPEIYPRLDLFQNVLSVTHHVKRDSTELPSNWAEDDYIPSIYWHVSPTSWTPTVTIQNIEVSLEKGTTTEGGGGKSRPGEPKPTQITPLELVRKTTGGTKIVQISDGATTQLPGVKLTKQDLVNWLNTQGGTSATFTITASVSCDFLESTHGISGSLYGSVSHDYTVTAEQTYSVSGDITFSTSITGIPLAGYTFVISSIPMFYLGIFLTFLGIVALVYLIRKGILRIGFL